MALTLPLQVFDGIFRCCGISGGFEGPSCSSISQERLAKIIIGNASLTDLFRWRRVSGAFKRAAEARLSSFTRIDVRIYDGLADLRNHHCEKDTFEWLPHGNVMLMDLGMGQLGIAVDTKMKSNDVKSLLRILMAFRHYVEELFMDSPIIELIVSQINKQQVNLLIEMLKITRKVNESQSSGSRGLISTSSPETIPGPFFTNLKKLTITSKSNQLEHLSRLVTYAVGVDFLYETQNMDLLCLKICIGGQWCQKRNVRMFRHVNKFRQWTEADSLGERYFQQFSGTTRVKSNSPRN
ncbi:hypothetical protein FO519_000398 [Halicephalobus sp. NKZ332]|nr:hypothetical protein FO519_000398 [Halicephalobus sp. NKZ332]